MQIANRSPILARKSASSVNSNSALYPTKYSRQCCLHTSAKHFSLSLCFYVSLSLSLIPLTLCQHKSIVKWFECQSLVKCNELQKSLRLAGFAFHQSLFLSLSLSLFLPLFLSSLSGFFSWFHVCDLVSHFK